MAEQPPPRLTPQQVDAMYQTGHVPASVPTQQPCHLSPSEADAKTCAIGARHAIIQVPTTLDVEVHGLITNHTSKVDYVSLPKLQQNAWDGFVAVNAGQLAALDPARNATAGAHKVMRQAGKLVDLSGLLVANGASAEVGCLVPAPAGAGRFQQIKLYTVKLGVGLN
eukprot:TRINITY_DN47792_c0_g1_i2.p1 TRINITY_DN47792_c0_g1~~TRINITY_DN47792_c0_g1_i2.p1  ORF type:complete len:167 (-),score=16.43 TRINITY_DN47792_c0_g1_i2:399-899(-)